MFIEWPMAGPLIDTGGRAVNKTEFLASRSVHYNNRRQGLNMNARK